MIRLILGNQGIDFSLRLVLVEIMYLIGFCANEPSHQSEANGKFMERNNLQSVNHAAEMIHYFL
jgi:hypothetical protein